MTIRFTDKEIGELVREPKPKLPPLQALRWKDKRSHRECEVDIEGEFGSSFKIIMRQNSLNALDFTVILAYCPPNSNQLFRLRRYNGKSHEHSNHIEKQRFYGYHIHMATQRYQELGANEDAFAVQTEEYSDLQSAVRCLERDCFFKKDDSGQIPLFK